MGREVASSGVPLFMGREVASSGVPLFMGREVASSEVPLFMGREVASSGVPRRGVPDREDLRSLATLAGARVARDDIQLVFVRGKEVKVHKSSSRWPVIGGQWVHRPLTTGHRPLVFGPLATDH
jgi:hypothetical protein